MNFNRIIHFHGPLDTKLKAKNELEFFVEIITNVKKLNIRFFTTSIISLATLTLLIVKTI